MSPSRFHQDHHQDHHKIIINGPRPSPLKLNKESHLIHKSSTSSSSSNSSSSSVAAAFVPGAAKRSNVQPVIIYANSPKVIHTQARDFMALVQKLTGLSRPNNNNNDDDHNNLGTPPQPHPEPANDTGSELDGGKNNNNDSNIVIGKHEINNDENKSSSVLIEDNGCGTSGRKHGSDGNNRYFADVPLFTPTAAQDFFCSPRPVYRYPDSAFASPNMASPSFLDFFKGLPEY